MKGPPGRHTYLEAEGLTNQDHCPYGSKKKRKFHSNSAYGIKACGMHRLSGYLLALVENFTLPEFSIA